MLKTQATLQFGRRELRFVKDDLSPLFPFLSFERSARRKSVLKLDRYRSFLKDASFNLASLFHLRFSRIEILSSSLVDTATLRTKRSDLRIQFLRSYHFLFVVVIWYTGNLVDKYPESMTSIGPIQLSDQLRNSYQIVRWNYLWLCKFSPIYQQQEQQQEQQQQQQQVNNLNFIQ